MLQRLLNHSEHFTYKKIETALQGSGLSIFPQQMIRNVIDTKDLSLTKKEHRLWKESSFDFVITDRENKPLFVVEFDGPDHDRPERLWADVKKLSICQQARLPILKIDDQFLTEYEHMSVIEFLIGRYLRWEEQKEAAIEEFRATIQLLQDRGKALDDILEDVLPPEVEFNFRHYFPPFSVIERRLAKEHNLMTDYMAPDNPRLLSTYRLKTSFSNSDHRGHVQAVARYEVEGDAVRLDETRHFNWSVEATADMRWAYHRTIPAGELEAYLNQLPSQIREHCHSLAARRSVVFGTTYYSGIPGTSIPEIAEMLSSYKCLKLIEDRCISLCKNGWRFKNPEINDIDQYFDP